MLAADRSVSVLSKLTPMELRIMREIVRRKYLVGIDPTSTAYSDRQVDMIIEARGRELVEQMIDWYIRKGYAS